MAEEERFGFSAINASRCLCSALRARAAEKHGLAQSATLLPFGRPSNLCNTYSPQKYHPDGVVFSWRRRRDSNSRTAYDRYTISNRAPSTKLGDSSKSYSVFCLNSEWYYTASECELQAFFSNEKIYLGKGLYAEFESDLILALIFVSFASGDLASAHVRVEAERRRVVRIAVQGERG